MPDQQITSDQFTATTILPEGPGGMLLPGAPLTPEFSSLKLPGCEFISTIGKGGMGVVFLVRQERLDRYVAVKMLPRDVASDKKYLARLEREARVLATMNHANIVGCHDIVTTDDGTFVILEFVPGRLSVRDLIVRFKSIPEAVVVRIALDVVRGLAYAHEKGITHRDVKPHNLLIFSEDMHPPREPENIFSSPNARVMICDFGIAKRGERGGTMDDGDVEHTVVGSPAYMAPEQAVGQEDADFRADIYSLGVTLYQLVTGKIPFKGETPLETIRMKTETDLPDPRQAGALISARFAAIIQRMAKADRSERYQNYGELLADLEVVAGETLKTAKGSRRRFPPAFWSGLAVGGVCVLLGIGVGAAKVRQLFTPVPISRTATLGFWEGDRSAWRRSVSDRETSGPTIIGFSRENAPLILKQTLAAGDRVHLKVRLPGDGSMVSCRLVDDQEAVRYELRWVRGENESLFVSEADSREIPLADISERSLLEWLEVELELENKSVVLHIDGRLTAIAPLKVLLGDVHLALAVPSGRIAQFKDVWIFEHSNHGY